MTVALGIAALAAVWVAYAYNRLVRARNRVENGWKQIDVQLKRRHDLVPNLVSAVKGALEFEQDTLEKVIGARGRAAGARGVRESAAAEGVLGEALRQLLAVVERYPDLRGNDNVLRLQEELTTTENQIGFSRQHYNDVAMRFNTQCEVFPNLLIAGVLGFAKADYFEIGETDRVVPGVDLSLRADTR